MPVPPRPLPRFFTEPRDPRADPEVPGRLHPRASEGRVVTTGSLLAAGVSPFRLRGADMSSPGRGLRALAGAEPGCIDMTRALVEVTPGEPVLSHSTAAWLWGMWLPRRWEDERSVHLSMPRGAPSRPRRRGVVGHRLPKDADVVRCAGFTVTSPAWTWTDLATQLVPWGRPERVPPAVEERALEDLVIAGESLVQTPLGAAARREPGEHPRCRLKDLVEVVDRRPNVRGVRLLRAALPLLRAGSGSPAESRLRLRLTAAGFPEPEMNRPLTLPDGSRIMPDLVWPALKICLEYEGDHHRVEAEQFRADIRRVRRLEAAGWICLRTAGDVWTEAGMRALSQDLVRAFARRGVQL